MINKIEAEKLADTIADQLRVRLSYHSVTMELEDQDALRNYLHELLSNYVSDQLMTGDA